MLWPSSLILFRLNLPFSNSLDPKCCSPKCPWITQLQIMYLTGPQASWWCSGSVYWHVSDLDPTIHTLENRTWTQTRKTGMHPLVCILYILDYTCTIVYPCSEVYAQVETLETSKFYSSFADTLHAPPNHVSHASASQRPTPTTTWLMRPWPTSRTRTRIGASLSAEEVSGASLSSESRAQWSFWVKDSSN